MALKKFRFGLTIGTHDPSADVPEVRDQQSGVLLMQGQKGLKHIPAGTEVELEEAEGNRIHALYPFNYERWLSAQDAKNETPSEKSTKRLGWS